MARVVRISLVIVATAGFFMNLSRLEASESETVAENTGQATLTVESADPPKIEEETVPFLRSNLDFFRARLDRLRQVWMLELSADATPLDPRLAHLLDMAREIGADSDSVAASRAEIEQLEILESAAEIARIEGEISLLDEILLRQEKRLRWLDEDFRANQQTTLIVLASGMMADKMPERIVLIEDNTTTRVGFDDAIVAGLRRGGLIKVHHTLAEPRPMTVQIGFEGGGWTAVNPASIDIYCERDRVTFIELDLSTVENEMGSVEVATRRWTR